MIKVKEITITRGEGLIEECGKTVTVTSFIAADSHLREWAMTAPEVGYDKCDFKVTWEDGETYEGRFDLKREHLTKTELLAEQIFSTLEWYAGRTAHPHCGMKKYRQFLSTVETVVIEGAEHMIDHYQISDLGSATASLPATHHRSAS